jgi:hypothetical protein
MANAKIFLVTPQDNLTTMTETAYVKEDVLQTFLERYPDLLGGDQINPNAPRRWLLVRREMPIPDDETDTGRWSLDHLFLDQDGVPTFVECKRATDTRSRREVVAQMLDYAANGVEYWGIDRIRQAAAETAQAQGQELDEQVRRLANMDDEAEVEPYWKTVEENLRRGRVRLLFVADETTKELRRLVEFLNDKIAAVEVLAVEIKQFLGEGQTALVPRVIGITETARQAKGSAPTTKRTQTPAEFLANCTPEAARVFETVIGRAQAKGHTIYWGGVGRQLSPGGTPRRPEGSYAAWRVSR